MSKKTQTAELDNLLKQAVMLCQAGQFVQAKSIYKKLLKSAPINTEILSNLGTIEIQLGRLDEGIQLLQRSLKINPNQPNALFNVGNEFYKLKRYEEAITNFNLAIAINPMFAEAHCNKGIVLREQGEFEQAIACYDTAIACQPSYARAHYNRSVALLDIKQYEQALASIDQAIALNPNASLSHFHKGLIVLALKQFHEALGNFNASVKLNQSQPLVYFYMAKCSLGIGNIKNAIQYYDSSIQISPDIYTYIDRGVAYEQLGDFNMAIESYDAAISLQSDCAEAHLNKTFVKLLLGEFRDGWQQLEWRWKLKHNPDMRNFSQPAWLGDTSVAGKNILIYTEQGFGDTLQFCRYIPMIESLGGHAIFEVPASLLSLMTSMKSNFTIVERGNPLPTFDLQCPTMSLPLAFKTTVETIPSTTPYLFADNEKVKQWQDKIGASSKLKIGLVWAGGLNPDQIDDRKVNSRRNIQLEKLACLSAIDAEFYSLQKGEPAEADLANIKLSNWGGPGIIDYTAQLHDFSDTAALIQNLDLVISVDTSTAHLAGALGKPVWVLNRFDTCWRWMLDRNDTPWYPTMRLFRQTNMGSWDNVLIEVVDELKNMIANNDNTSKKSHSA